MALIGASVAVALFGFALVAAAGLRRGISGERRRLAQRGATRPQLFVASLTEVGVIAFAGWLLGIVAGAIAVAAIASAKGLPAGTTVEHALWTRDALLVLAVCLHRRRGRLAGRRRLGRSRPNAVRAFACSMSWRSAPWSRWPWASVAARFTRGPVPRGTRRSCSCFPRSSASPAGSSPHAVLAPLMRLAERTARRASVSLRLALLALARAPARTGAAGAFLVVTVSLIVFAAAYAATLERGARDEAAFAVPLDLTISSGGSLVQPLDAAPVERLRAAGRTERERSRRYGRPPKPAGWERARRARPCSASRRARSPGCSWRADYANRSQAAIVRALTTEPRRLSPSP